MQNNPELIEELKKDLKFEVSCAIGDELDNYVDMYAEEFLTEADSYYMSNYFDLKLAPIIDELVDNYFNE